MIRQLRPAAILFTTAILASACGGASPDVIAAAASTIAPSTTAVPSTSAAAPITAPVETTTATTAAAPATTAAPSPAGLQLPSLLMVDGNVVRSVGPMPDGSIRSDIELVAQAPVRVAYMTSDLTIITEEHPIIEDPFGSGEIVHYLHDGTREVIDGIDQLFGIEVINDEESIIGSETRSSINESGEILAIGLDAGTIVDLGLAWGPEYGVGSVEWSDYGIAVVSAWSDLTESVSYIDAAGAAVGLLSPTDGLAYASPPLIQAAALSPDGDIVVWAEGPDSGYDPDTGDFVFLGDTWVVKGMDLATGRIEFAMPIDFGGVDSQSSVIESIRYGSTHLVVNRSQVVGDARVDLAPVMIDMTGAEPAVVPFGIVGNASFILTPTPTPIPTPPSP